MLISSGGASGVQGSFIIYDPFTPASRFVASPSDNVGIGTTLSGVTLDVKGHIADSGLAATLGACGTAPAINGNDTKG